MVGTPYNDLYMRDWPGDDGTYPDVTAEGVCAGPDVINRGPGSANILTHQQLIDGYSNLSDPSNTEHDPVDGTVSRIYVRAKNLYSTTPYPSWTEETQPRIYLRQMSPTIGYDISAMGIVPNANSLGYALLSPETPGEICPGDQPFMLEGDFKNWGGHHCLCATVVTEMNPDPFPEESFTDWYEFDAWVREHPNVCWHNVWTVANQGTFCEQYYEFANNSKQPQPHTFLASWKLAPNTTVRVSADPNQAAGFTGINKSQVVTGKPGPDGLVSGNFTTSGNFPAGYQTTIYLTVTTPDGQPLPAGATTDLSSAGVTTLAKVSPSLRNVAIPLAHYPLQIQQEIVAALAPERRQAPDLVTMAIANAQVVYRPQQNP